MSVRSNKSTSRQQIHPAVVVVAVVALVAFIIWIGMRSFAGPPQGNLPPPPTQDLNYIVQKAKECQGDFKKLSAADQAKVQKITQGWGESTMASKWNQANKPKN